MTPFIAKMIVLAGMVAWFVIRLPHQRRARKTAIAKSARTMREKLLLCGSVTGLGIIPVLYIATGMPAFADYPFRSWQAWLGALIFLLALLLFIRVHRELGRNWSDSLEVRDRHVLITHGLYAYVRHPMYSAFFLWAVAQALLLPNLIAGLSGLIGFGTLFAFRVGREERLMLETFGDEYRAYMSRTKRLIPGIY